MQNIHAFEHTIIILASSHIVMLELWFHDNCREVLEFLVVRNKQELQSRWTAKTEMTLGYSISNSIETCKDVIFFPLSLALVVASKL